MRLIDMVYKPLMLHTNRKYMRSLGWNLSFLWVLSLKPQLELRSLILVSHGKGEYLAALELLNNPFFADKGYVSTACKNIIDVSQNSVGKIKVIIV